MTTNPEKAPAFRPLEKRDRHKAKVLFIFNICTHYRKPFFEHFAQFYNVEFLFFSEGGEAYFENKGSKLLGNFKGRYLKGWSIGQHFRFTPGLFTALLFQKPDVIIKCINGPLPLFASFLIAKLRGIPFILWTGIWNDLQTTFHRFARPMVNFIYKNAGAIVTYGDHVKNYLVEKGIDGSKIFPAYQAHDASIFLAEISNNQKSKIREQFRIGDKKVVLFVGRMVAEKGVFELIDAFKKLNRTDALLLLIGGGELENEVKSAIAQVDSAIHIPYIEHRNLVDYFAIADIFVLPSRTTPTFREPWGFVVNEAMCQRCAVVASDAVGAARGGLIEYGKNGIVFPEGNVDALTGELNRILDDDELRESLQNNAHNTMKNWTFEKMQHGFDAGIEHAIGQKKKRKS